MNNYWISWYETDITSFEWHGPWWITGERLSDGAITVVAAVQAEDDGQARAAIINAHDGDDLEDVLEWRFCQSLSEDWDPLNIGDRFVAAEWMKWPMTAQRNSALTAMEQGA